MEGSDFLQKVKEISQYLDGLLAARGDGAAPGSVPTEEQVTRYQVLLEELQVTLEELHQTNEELVAAQQVGEQERRRYQDLFSFAPSGVLVTDLGGKILEANPAAARMVGRSLTLLSGSLLISRVHSDDRKPLRDLLAAIARQPDSSGDSVTLDVRVSRGEDEYLDVTLTVAKVRREVSGQPSAALLWNLHDISELKSTQAALEEANRELEQRVSERAAQLSQANADLKTYAAQMEQKNRELQDFAFFASHDLKEPLRKIKAFSDLVADSNQANLEPSAVDYLHRMTRAVERMEAMLAGLLDYSRVATAEKKFRPVDLNAAVAEALDLLEMRIEKAHATVTVGDLPTVEGDPQQIQRLLQNLLSNAIKFHPPESAPQVGVWGEAAGGMARIHIKDDGIGFQEEFIERIFQPFARLHGRGVFEGTGMGLAICRKIVERHAGKISVHSRLDEGATFTIELPVKQPG